MFLPVQSFSFARFPKKLDEGRMLQRSQAALALLVVEFVETFLKIGVEPHPAAELCDGAARTAPWKILLCEICQVDCVYSFSHISYKGNEKRRTKNCPAAVCRLLRGSRPFTAEQSVLYCRVVSGSGFFLSGCFSLSCLFLF